MASGADRILDEAVLRDSTSRRHPWAPTPPWCWRRPRGSIAQAKPVIDAAGEATPVGYAGSRPQRNRRHPVRPRQALRGTEEQRGRAR